MISSKRRTNDLVVVHVTNSMQNNGTSIHWHGFRQMNSSEQDGVASITQCPVAPGDSMTYRFRATQVLAPRMRHHWCLLANQRVVRNHLVSQPLLSAGMVSRRPH